LLLALLSGGGMAANVDAVRLNILPLPLNTERLMPSLQRPEVAQALNSVQRSVPGDNEVATAEERDGAGDSSPHQQLPDCK